MPDERIGLVLDYGDSKKSTEEVSSKLDVLKSAAKAAGIEGFDVLVESDEKSLKRSGRPVRQLKRRDKKQR